MIRDRYAPSPTGLQHIGGIRTALFNYLFARSRGGKFILRLEDTDRTRYDEAFVQNLYDTFSWLGIHWDEGPDTGGPFAPYVQSRRTELYQTYAEQLLERGGPTAVSVPRSGLNACAPNGKRRIPAKPATTDNAGNSARKKARGGRSPAKPVPSG
jgi:glutamyl/glutaminyl-tRNA synthetase